MGTKVRSEYFKGVVHNIDVYFDNMPWKKARINPARTNTPDIVVNAEVMESIGKWIEKS